MNRSGSQKILLVVSILDIVSGVIVIIGGLMSGVLGGAAVVAPSTELASQGLTTQEAGVAAGAFGIIAILLVVLGLVDVVLGVLGVRAANDNQKIMPVWVLSIISLAFVVIQIIAGIVQGNFQPTSLLSLVVSGLMLWVANNIKVEAGK